MLHKETITAGTLDLMQRLMKDQQLLADSTVLYLRIGASPSKFIFFILQPMAADQHLI
jgi:hypothetical protein